MTRRQLSCTLAALGLLGFTPLFAGCNTVAGIGRDLQAAGAGITGSSERATRRDASPAQTPAPSPPPPNP